KTRERTLGALTLVSAESGRRFGDADLAFAQELARRAALAIEVAQLSEARALAEAGLRAEREALAVSNRELDQFAYVASHDLKAPLRGIANLSQWIEEDLADVMTDQTREQMRLLRGR